MSVEYAVFEDNTLLFICQDESLAQEMVLSLTEEYVYNAFCQECNKVGLEMALWLFKNSSYGKNKYIIRQVKRIVN